jgi:hypothetical protein
MKLIIKPLTDSAGAEVQDIAALILIFCWPNFREGYSSRQLVDSKGAGDVKSR